ncbi:MAG: ABC transporter permease subunit [Candidatus Dormibacteraeota bacterium]|nr:ABC transporter permease subunit [Candidatus Dormibacteraeota bacterium]
MTTVAAPRVRPVADTRTGRPKPGGGWSRSAVVALFMAPAAVLLGAIVIYPTIGTMVRSLYDDSGHNFVGGANYQTLFGTANILVALRNNAIWVIVFPFMVTFIGLVFAVLIERIRWSTAFKTIVFMPMAISLFATGVIWRIVYETDPSRGVINAAIGTVADAVHPPGFYALPNIKPISGLTAAADGSMVSKSTAAAGGTLQLGLTGISPSSLPAQALAAHPPAATAGAVSGVVWRDFSPGGHIGVIDPGEKGLPSMHLNLVGSDGKTVATTSSTSDGTFRFTGTSGSGYHVVVDPSNFRPAFAGVSWLGDQSLTPVSGLGSTGRALLAVPLADLSAIVAMMWVWSGFAMVIIGAGLAALNREVLEAARMDGASELQTFRHVTFPLLRPVLIVVFITMIINVLKIFDIILSLVPESSQQQTNVIALEMWRRAFQSFQPGLGSAIAVVLFVLVIPVIAINVRRIRG